MEAQAEGCVRRGSFGVVGALRCRRFFGDVAHGYVGGQSQEARNPVGQHKLQPERVPRAGLQDAGQADFVLALLEYGELDVVEQPVEGGPGRFLGDRQLIGGPIVGVACLRDPVRPRCQHRSGEGPFDLSCRHYEVLASAR